MEIYEKTSRINNYLIDDGSEDKKAKGTKNMLSVENLNLEITKFVLKQLDLKIK